MTSSYESSFHKIVSLSELPIGTPKAFRAAGTTVVIRRTDRDVTAIHASTLAEARWATEWDQVLAHAGLIVRVENGEVWVCLEGCSA